ncbi:alpha/beta fold hydrolase [Kribbella antibiotica]|uniref:Alpha/beta fold hydrolase n=1 Tax=Kribbella antibiotica TaxID=190195 RepID=A0A4R4Z6U7_9ACTN|nr:alpha/beta hydrolase [Kribbella antibiotica]TDD51862.1 alpha/beta fold hydrolase [Kribbella antibiotica]
MSEVVLDRGDVQLRGTATGAGPTVLLLHAGGEERGVWAPVAAVLNQRGLRTFAFDLRGHGESSGEATSLQAIAEDVTAMIRYEPGPVVVVGASLGGLAAIGATASPGAVRRVAGLILVDVVPTSDSARARAWLDERGLRDEHGELVEDIFEHSAELLRAASTIEVPILLVRAGPTSPIADGDVDRFRGVCPALAIELIPESGHLIAHDAPDQLARLIGDRATAWLRPNE